MSVAGILDAMRSDRPLSERVVWQCLENHANGHRFWAISIDDMAAELHLRPGTIVDAVQALERDGIVRPDRRRRCVTVYYMLRSYPPADSSVPVSEIQTVPIDSENRNPTPDWMPETEIKAPELVPETETQTPVFDSENRHVDNPPSKNPPVKEESQRARVTGSRLGSDDDPDFVAFWDGYPRKDDKGHARKAWLKARRTTSAAAILAGLHGYPFSESPRFVPLPATWLNGERWLAAAEADMFDPVLRAVGLTPEDFAGPIVEYPWMRALQ